MTTPLRLRLLLPAAIAVTALVMLSIAAHAGESAAPKLGQSGPSVPAPQDPVLSFQTGHPRFDPDLRAWRARQEQDRTWSPSTQFPDMRDGSPPPWDRSRWGR